MGGIAVQKAAWSLSFLSPGPAALPLMGKQ